MGHTHPTALPRLCCKRCFGTDVPKEHFPSSHPTRDILKRNMLQFYNVDEPLFFLSFYFFTPPVSSPKSRRWILRLEGSNHTKAYYNPVTLCKVRICNFKQKESESSWQLHIIPKAPINTDVYLYKASISTRVPCLAGVARPPCPAQTNELESPKFHPCLSELVWGIPE